MLIKISHYYINLATLAYIVRQSLDNEGRTLKLIFANGLELILNAEDSAEFERVLYSLESAHLQGIRKLVNQRLN